MSGFSPPLTDNDIAKEYGKVVRATALEVYARVQQRTPRDTGNARFNWHISTGRESSQEADARGASGPVIPNRLDRAQTERFAPVFIQNNVPYIGRLEFGSSDQAPQGMVRVTLAEFGQ